MDKHIARKATVKAESEGRVVKIDFEAEDNRAATAPSKIPLTMLSNKQLAKVAREQRLVLFELESKCDELAKANETLSLAMNEAAKMIRNNRALAIRYRRALLAANMHRRHGIRPVRRQLPKAPKVIDAAPPGPPPPGVLVVPAGPAPAPVPPKRT